MNESELIKKIMKKKEFSHLPVEDVRVALSKFDSKRYLDEERIKLTRDLLRRVYSGYSSSKILSLKDKDVNWILRKHLSTRERLPYYKKVYSRILSDLPNNLSIIDLGSGINGFSYSFFSSLGYFVNYLSIEAVGQLVDLMNSYFSREAISARAIHLSLFELERIKSEVMKIKGFKILFLFKVIDCLEMLEKDYSKKLLEEIAPNVDRVIVSFATRSMNLRKRFFVNRKWILDFISENFSVLDDFEIGGERYVVFCKRGQDL